MHLQRIWLFLLYLVSLTVILYGVLITNYLAQVNGFVGFTWKNALLILLFLLFGQYGGDISFNCRTVSWKCVVNLSIVDQTIHNSFSAKLSCFVNDIRISNGISVTDLLLCWLHVVTPTFTQTMCLKRFNQVIFFFQ